MNRIWFDTEFIEDGKTIDLISIGLVREDGVTFYAENSECDLDRASPWVVQNVLPHLKGGEALMDRSAIANRIYAFAGPSPEFWAYFGAYDWVVLCQLFGTMMDLPNDWPMFVRDVQQVRSEMGVDKLPEQASTQHDALADALWTREAWEFLQRKAQPA